MARGKEEEKSLNLPCYLPTFSQSGNRERVLVELHLPDRGIPAFVKREDLSVKPAKGYGFEGWAELQIVEEDEINFQVRIKGGYPSQTFKIPKNRLQI
jgi:hypothetical protein